MTTGERVQRSRSPRRGRGRILRGRAAAVLGGVLAGLMLAFPLAGAVDAHTAHRAQRTRHAHRERRTRHAHRARRAHRASQSDTAAQYLSLAEAGVTRAGASNAWGNSDFNWYNEVLNDTARSPQATIWAIVPLFETVDYDALAHPSTTNLDLVKHFVDKAETYWNVNVTPAPGVTRTTPAYSPYPGATNDPKTFFDDNAWFSLAFVDAYRVMVQAGDSNLASRYLNDAIRGFNFIRENGWDEADGGGMFWNTYHEIPGGHGRSGEALGAATDLAARLYQATGDSIYLATAIKYITWANNNILKWDGSYASSDLSDEVTMPHDGEGAMISAFTALCQSRAGAVPSAVYAQVPPNKTQGQHPSFRLPDDPASWCSWAEGLAHDTAYGVNPGGGALDAYFPLSEGPQWDAIYVRGLLSLYAHDHDSSWYHLATATAGRILSNAPGADALYLKTWDGSSVVPGTDPGEIRTHAASISVLAALGATPAP